MSANGGVRRGQIWDYSQILMDNINFVLNKNKTRCHGMCFSTHVSNIIYQLTVKMSAHSNQFCSEILQGIVKIGAVDADQHKSLGGQYGVRGFPTIKVFGANKNKPEEYQGTDYTTAPNKPLLLLNTPLCDFTKPC